MSKKSRKKFSPSQPPRSTPDPDSILEPDLSASAPEQTANVLAEPKFAETFEPSRQVTHGPFDVTALLECQAGFARGVAMMGQAMLGLTRESMQGAAETGLALIDSRSLPGVWALGLQLARDQMDRVLRSSAEITEIGWRTATTTCGPLFSLARTSVEEAARSTRIS